jgi:hypothetical protein
MAHGTPLRDQTFPSPRQHAAGERLAGIWEKVRLGIVRSVFWSYERGSWQYDIICAVILIFIFLPRSWFRDRPRLELANLRHHQGVIELSHSKGEWTYQIDARLVESLPDMKLDDAIREILRRRLRKVPQLKSLEAIRDANDVVLGYTVVVTQ